MRIIIFLVIVISSLITSVVVKGAHVNTRKLLEKCEQARSMSQYDEMKVYSDQLLKNADEIGDFRSLTYAYFYNGLARMFLGEGDESMRLLDKAEDLAIAHENDSVEALVYNSKGIYHALVKNNSFVAQQYFFKSLQLATKVNYDDLQYRVRSNLLTLTRGSGEEGALDNATRVYKYGVEKKNYELISLGSFHLASYYYEHKKYDEARKYIDEALKAYDKQKYDDIASVYSLYALMETAKGNLDEAERLARLGIELAQENNQPSLEVDAWVTCSEVLERKGKYNDAIAMVKEAMAVAQEIGMTNKTVACCEIIARCYSNQGNTTEALKYSQQANKLLNEQSTINMQRMSYEQQVLHEMEQKELDTKIKQEQIASQRQFLIMLGLVVAVLLVLLIFVVHTYRRRNKLYKGLVHQNTIALARQEAMQKKIVQLTRECDQLREQAPKENVQDPRAAERDSQGLDDEKINTLYTYLCTLMDDERLYAEPQLTRERMAERLGTNRTYLTRVIKEKTGMSYLQFINSYRINEALKILSDKDKVSYPLKQIWTDLGFSSSSTFFKIFQQTVGITPAAYRKQFLEVNNDMPEDDEE